MARDENRKFSKEELISIAEILKAYMKEHPERSERDKEFSEQFSEMTSNLCHDDFMYIGDGYFEYIHG